MYTRVLSVKQPHAWLITHGHKDVENRTWLTHHRGPLVIHASQRPASSEMPAFRAWCAEQGLEVPTLVHGAIVGGVTVRDVIDCSPSPWAYPHTWHWVLEEPWALDRPVPCSGTLNLYLRPEHVQKALRRRRTQERAR